MADLGGYRGPLGLIKASAGADQASSRTTPATGRAESMRARRSRWSSASAGTGSAVRGLGRVLDQFGDLGQQQAGRAVDGAAAAGERPVGEPAAGVGQHDPLGASFDGQPVSRARFSATPAMRSASATSGSTCA